MSELLMSAAPFFNVRDVFFVGEILSPLIIIKQFMCTIEPVNVRGNLIKNF